MYSSVRFIVIVLLVLPVMSVAAGADNKVDNQLWDDYQAMKEQYRQAYRAHDPYRPKYSPDDPRAARYNQVNQDSLMRAESMRAKLREAMEAQKNVIRQKIQSQ